MAVLLLILQKSKRKTLMVRIAGGANLLDIAFSFT